jgi:hypothetical protein
MCSYTHTNSSLYALGHLKDSRSHIKTPAAGIIAFIDGIPTVPHQPYTD